MKLNAIPIIYLIFIAALTSCTSYNTVAKKEKINNTVLAKLKKNKKHAFYMKSGLVLYVRIDSIKNDTIYGRMPQPKGIEKKGEKIPFAGSFESINKNIVKIKQRRFNPYLTVLALTPFILIPVFQDGWDGGSIAF